MEKGGAIAICNGPCTWVLGAKGRRMLALKTTDQLGQGGVMDSDFAVWLIRLA